MTGPLPPAQPPAARPDSDAPEVDAPARPPPRTKYDDLVDVLADGLFDMILEGDSSDAPPTSVTPPIPSPEVASR